MADYNSTQGGSRQNVRTDKFGNSFMVVGCKDKKGNGYPVGYVELCGKLYKLEPSSAEKEGVAAWIRITALKKRPTNTSM